MDSKNLHINNHFMKSVYKLWLKANNIKIKKSQIVIQGDWGFYYISHVFNNYNYYMSFVFLDYGTIKIKQTIAKEFDFDQGE